MVRGTFRQCQMFEAVHIELNDPPCPISQPGRSGPAHADGAVCVEGLGAGVGRHKAASADAK